MSCSTCMSRGRMTWRPCGQSPPLDIWFFQILNKNTSFWSLPVYSLVPPRYKQLFVCRNSVPVQVSPGQLRFNGAEHMQVSVPDEEVEDVHGFYTVLVLRKQIARSKRDAALLGPGLPEWGPRPLHRGSVQIRQKMKKSHIGIVHCTVMCTVSNDFRSYS